MTGPVCRTLMFAVVACVLSASIADFFFYIEPIGWTVSAYLLYLAICLIMRKFWLARSRQTILILIALFGLNVSLILDLGCVAPCLYVLALMTLAGLQRGEKLTKASLLPRMWARVVSGAATRICRDIPLLRHLQKSRGLLGGRKTTTSWAFPLLLTLVFVFLFGIANPIIEEWLRQLGRVMTHVPRAGRICLWLAFFVVSWGLLRVCLRQKEIREQHYVPPFGQRADKALTGDLVTRCLILFNIVFAVQNGLDLRYLSGWESLPDGMSYAEYAHRGAYPLVFTAILAACFILIAFHPKGVANRAVLARRLVYVWIAQNVLLLLSSVWRLRLYVDTYSLTRLRSAAGIWMLLVVMGLVWIALRIILRKTNAWLININAACLGFVLYVCCFINFDGIIADHNVRHCREVGIDAAELDLEYLEYLGFESIPALEWFANNVDSTDGARDARAASQRLKTGLRSCMSDWRGWTLERRCLLDLVSAKQMEGGNHVTK